MFVKNKFSCKFPHHRNSRKSQNRNLMHIMHYSFTFPFFCTLLAGSIFVTQMVLALGQVGQDGMVQEDMRFSKRHFHRQQNRNNLLSIHRRSIQSNNNGAQLSQNSIIENQNNPSPGVPGSSTGRPAVCSSCFDRELYRNLTKKVIK